MCYRYFNTHIVLRKKKHKKKKGFRHIELRNNLWRILLPKNSWAQLAAVISSFLFHQEQASQI
jgi:hypothetical protein